MPRSLRPILLLFMLLALTAACEELLTGLDDGDARTRLTGTWRVQETSEIYSSTSYLIEIDKHLTDSTRIYIDNIYNVDGTAEAIVNGRSLSIPEQLMDGGFRISGTGSVSGDYDQISWQYTVDDGSGQLDHVSATYRPF